MMNEENEFREEVNFVQVPEDDGAQAPEDAVEADAEETGEAASSVTDDLEKLAGSIGNLLGQIGKKVEEAFTSPETEERAEQIKQQMGETAERAGDAFAKGAAVVSRGLEKGISAIGDFVTSALNSVQKGMEEACAKQEEAPETPEEAKEEASDEEADG